MDFLYYNSIMPEEMGLDYEAYKEFCEINDIEPSAEDSKNFYEWQGHEMHIEFNDVLREIRLYDKKHYGHYYVDANLGLWNGRKSGFNVFDSLTDAVWACIENMDYIKIELFEDGSIEIRAIHHDGTNCFMIYKMSEEDYERYDKWLWSVTDEDFELTDYSLKIA